MTHGKPALLGLIAALAAVVALSVPGGMTAEQARLFAVVLVSLGLWATGALPTHVTTLLFFATLLVTGLAAPEAVFSGFSSAAMWLVVSGFVIGAAVTGSGLGARLGARAAPHLARSYPRLIAGLMLAGMVLGFLMPSSVGRATVLVPLGMALAEPLGFAKGSPGRTGVALAIALSANMPSFAILTANIPNIVLAGASEKVLGITLSYADYLLLHYPVLGLLKAAALTALILRLYPAEARPAAAPALAAEAGVSPRRQAWLIALLLATLGLWATDGIHHVNPAWIGLSTATLLMLPRLGFLSPADFRGAVDFAMLLFIAGVLALGTLVGSSGLGSVIAHAVTGLLPLAPGHDFGNFLSLSALASLTAVVTTTPGLPAVLTPLAPELAQASGFSTEAVLMTQVVGFSTVLFPYQAAPLLVAMGLTGEPLRPLVRLSLMMAALSYLVFLPLDFLWWKALGWI